MSFDAFPDMEDGGLRRFGKTAQHGSDLLGLTNVGIFIFTIILLCAGIPVHEFRTAVIVLLVSVSAYLVYLAFSVHHPVPYLNSNLLLNATKVHRVADQQGPVPTAGSAGHHRTHRSRYGRAGPLLRELERGPLPVGRVGGPARQHLDPRRRQPGALGAGPRHPVRKRRDCARRVAIVSDRLCPPLTGPEHAEIMRMMLMKTNCAPVRSSS